MIYEDIISLVPIVVPVATALVGLFVPSPGPAVIRWSAGWWASLVQSLAVVWQSKPVQTQVALEISPALQALINQAVTQAVAAVRAQPSSNAWLQVPSAPLAAIPVLPISQ